MKTKISLAKKETFWGLSHPLNYDKILLWLSLDKPTVELDMEAQPDWAQSMIKNSIIAGYIESEPEIVLEKSIEKELKKKTKKKTKKAIKKTTKQRKKSNKEGLE